MSIEAEKAFEKIQHPLIIKTLNEVGVGGMCLNTLKTIYDKPKS